MPQTNRFYFLILFLFIFYSSCHAQDEKEFGYLSFPDSGRWQILIDDSLINKESLKYLPLSPGKHILQASLINNKNWFNTKQIHHINIQAADTLYINLNKTQFEKDQLTTLHKMNIKTKSLYKVKNPPNIFKRYLKPGLIVTAVTANWASFYLKRKADDYYTEYNKTSNLSQMNYYYNKSADFDVYASVMLGVSVTALSVYLYFLITD